MSAHQSFRVLLFGLGAIAIAHMLSGAPQKGHAPAARRPVHPISAYAGPTK
jgi:hypothetical protein